LASLIVFCTRKYTYWTFDKTRSTSR